MNPTLENQTEEANKRTSAQVQPSISANSLASPVTVPTMTQPQVGTLPTSPVVNNVAKETGNIIAAQTAEAEDLAKLRREYGALSQQGSLTDVYNQQLQKGGVTDESFRELKDINLQLADRGTASDLTKTQIQGAAGQTLGQAQREVTQEDREAAVRDAGLAARAAVLQGSIETAQAAATQAVNIAFQDRQLTNTNLINQINDLSGVVDDQTQQLLDQKKQQYEADQAKIKELKDNIANAMVSGASQAEINRLTDPTTTDEDKLTLAQSITARGATEERGLDRRLKESQLLTQQVTRENLRDQIRERAEAGNEFGTIDGKAQSAVQLAANGYADRLTEAESVIGTLGSMFTGQTAVGGGLPSSLQSPERQQFEQAKRNFINSVLRRESGAAIADSEFDSADLQYFPQRGDSDEVVVQKQQNRNTVINNMYRDANIFRPVKSGDIIESEGVKYQVGADGQTLTPLE